MSVNTINEAKAAFLAKANEGLMFEALSDAVEYLVSTGMTHHDACHMVMRWAQAEGLLGGSDE